MSSFMVGDSVVKRIWDLKDGGVIVVWEWYGQKFGLGRC